MPGMTIIVGLSTKREKERVLTRVVNETEVNTLIATLLHPEISS